MNQDTKTLLSRLEHDRQQMMITKIMDSKACEVCHREVTPLINYTCPHCYNKQFRKE